MMQIRNRPHLRLPRCLALLAIALSAPATATSCPALPDLNDLQCVDTAHGWFYAAQAEAATRMAEDAADTATRFRLHFGREAPRGAVVAAGTARTLTPAARDRLEAAGARWQLPWLDATEKAALQRTALLAQLRRQLPDATDAALAARVDAALASRPTNDVGTDRSALRHEIGHLLLIRAFWPDTASTRTSVSAPAHYGGPGPDWLDELAAVLMESDAMAAQRRARLDAPDAASHLVSLPAFFAMTHPLLARLGALRPESGGVRMISGEDGARAAAEAGWFYVQARAVADFLLATTGDDSVFGDVAAHLASGGDLADWLATRGAAFGLPATMDALEAAWRRWLEARVPAGGAARAPAT